MENEIIYDAVDGVSQKCAYNGGGITALQQDTAALLSKGTVKSVQRGTYESTGSAYNSTEDIQIAQVNAEKCLLALDVFTAASSSSFVGYYSATLSNDKITVTFRSSSTDYLAQWQVIEFF